MSVENERILAPLRLREVPKSYGVEPLYRQVTGFLLLIGIPGLPVIVRSFNTLSPRSAIGAPANLK